MLIRIGITILFIASMMGDSDNLIVPAALFAIGAGLIYVGKRREADNEDIV